MRAGVDVVGLPELQARLTHARDGILNLEAELLGPLLQASLPQLVAASPTMRPRLWGAGDIWTLPAGGWIVGRVQLPDDLDAMTAHVQQLLDGQ